MEHQAAAATDIETMGNVAWLTAVHREPCLDKSTLLSYSLYNAYPMKTYAVRVDIADNIQQIEHMARSLYSLDTIAADQTSRVHVNLHNCLNIERAQQFFASCARDYQLKLLYVPYASIAKQNTLREILNIPKYISLQYREIKHGTCISCIHQKNHNPTYCTLCIAEHLDKQAIGMEMLRRCRQIEEEIKHNN